jgi:predicted ester cyclase
MTTAARAVDSRELVRRSFRAIEQPGSEDPADLVDPDFRNWEAVGPAADISGPEAFTAAIEMLNHAFSELRYEVLALVAERDLVAVRTLMHGVHTGPMRDLPPTGRPFAQSQSHWFRIVDGLIGEHWATRDDLGFLAQVGLAPGARVGVQKSD